MKLKDRYSQEERADLAKDAFYSVNEKLKEYVGFLLGYTDPFGNHCPANTYSLSDCITVVNNIPHKQLIRFIL